MIFKTNLLDMDICDMKELFLQMGEKGFRAGQVFAWVHRSVRHIDEMTDLSKHLRSKLSETSAVIRSEIERMAVSEKDGTRKYLLRFPDGNLIECVLMEYRHGFTACVSSQAGCRMGCAFCASTHAGFARNLTPGELLDQVLTMQQESSRRVGNIVIMGIGEPFDNYDNVVKFLRIANAPGGINIGFRNMTLSTCGLVPGILRFAEEGLPVTLSVSLHAPNDAVRACLMPVGKKYSIDKIIEACKIYTRAGGRRVTFEYALVSGVNDSDGNALELAARLKGMLCHINLIPVNAVPGTDFKKSGRARIEAFRMILAKAGLAVTVRRELGEDIEAACGQLRRSSMILGSDAVEIRGFQRQGQGEIDK